jgi:hypothetical protein
MKVQDLRSANVNQLIERMEFYPCQNRLNNFHFKEMVLFFFYSRLYFLSKNGEKQPILPTYTVL